MRLDAPRSPPPATVLHHLFSPIVDRVREFDTDADDDDTDRLRVPDAQHTHRLGRMPYALLGAVASGSESDEGSSCRMSAKAREVVEERHGSGRGNGSE